MVPPTDISLIEETAELSINDVDNNANRVRYNCNYNSIIKVTSTVWL